jgi:hypothetical protein
MFCEIVYRVNYNKIIIQMLEDFLIVGVVCS